MAYDGQPVATTTSQQARVKVSDGQSVRVTVPENSDLKAGSVNYLDGFLGFLVRDVKTGAGETAEGILNIENAEFETDQIDATKTFAKGNKVYWNATTSKLTTDATTVFAGVVTVAKDANDVIWFKLWSGYVNDSAAGMVGTLADLDTTVKTNTVLAINEVRTATVAADAKAVAAQGDVDALSVSVQGEPTFAVGAEAENVINVAVQLVDAAGADVATSCLVRVWLSDAAGGALVAAAPSGTVVVGTDGVILASLTAKKHLLVVTSATGQFDLDITEAGVKELFVNVEYQGNVYSSEAVTFA